MQIDQYFSSSYAEAREKLLTAAQKAGLEVKTYHNPEKGCSQEDLCTDVIWLGPKDAKKVLVTSSATHGPEGYLGSAVQLAAIETGAYSNLSESTATLLIHAVNPWGFSWGRRCNEDGIDIFRNFINFNNPAPNNNLYDKLINFIVPNGKFLGTRILAELGLAYCLLKYGRKNLKAAIPSGQYKHPQGPFYGGKEPCWSNVTLRSILREYLSIATDLVVIDYHTGIGQPGIGEFVGFDKPGDQNHERAKQCWGDNYLSVFSDETVAYEIHGILLNAYREEVGHANITFGAHEFGTVDEKKVFKALRVDHWFHTHGDPASEKAKATRNKMIAVFNRNDTPWRKQVFEQAFAGETNALKFLKTQ